MISIISMHRCLADQAGGDGLGDGGQCPDFFVDFFQISNMCQIDKEVSNWTP